MSLIGNAAAILVMLALLFVVGAAIFFPVMWAVRRGSTNPELNKPVPLSGLIQVAAVVLLLVGLAFFAESGNKVAVLLFAICGVAANIAAYRMSQKSKNDKGGNDT